MEKIQHPKELRLKNTKQYSNACVYKDKLTDYYKKTKMMGKLIVDCYDIEKILSLYQHYFQLLNKMFFYNRKLVDVYKKVKCDSDRIDKFTETHTNLENQIFKWKTDAETKYNEILDWYKESEKINNEKKIIETQLSKLNLLYDKQKSKTEKLAYSQIEKIDQYIIYNIDNIIDFLLVINESTNNIQSVSSLYRISNILKNIGIKSINEKQTDFKEVYTTIKEMVTDSTIINKLDDIVLYINKRNIITESYQNRKYAEITDEKLIEYIKELKTNYDMIENNNSIMSTIEEKIKNHTKLSKSILYIID